MQQLFQDAAMNGEKTVQDTYFEIASLKVYFMLCPHLLQPITYRIAFVF